MAPGMSPKRAQCPVPELHAEHSWTALVDNPTWEVPHRWCPGVEPPADAITPVGSDPAMAAMWDRPAPTLGDRPDPRLDVVARLVHECECGCPNFAADHSTAHTFHAPDEAVEAAESALWTGPHGEDGWRTADIRAALAAAAPHIRADERARVLAEVQAALRDPERYSTWRRKYRWYNPEESPEVTAADYLRDTLNQPTEGDRNE